LASKEYSNFKSVEHSSSFPWGEKNSGKIR